MNILRAVQLRAHLRARFENRSSRRQEAPTSSDSSVLRLSLSLLASAATRTYVDFVSRRAPVLSVIPAMLLLGAALPLAGQSLSIQSSDSLTPLGQAWTKGFAADQGRGRLVPAFPHPSTTVDLKSGTTTAVFEALSKKAVHVVLAPRSIRYPEIQACEQSAGTRPTEYKVAVNGVAVYVHPQNKVKVLSYDELFAVFSGKIRDWKEVGGAPGSIHLYGVETNSSVGELFLAEVMNGKEFASGIKFLPSSDLVSALVKDESGIGFGPLVQSSALRAVAVKRAYSSTPVEPSAETISNRFYPISRFVFAYAFANPQEPAAFLDWIRSDEGQKVAIQTGYYQLPPKWRPKP